MHTPDTNLLFTNNGNLVEIEEENKKLKIVNENLRSLLKRSVTSLNVIGGGIVELENNANEEETLKEGKDSPRRFSQLPNQNFRVQNLIKTIIKHPTNEIKKVVPASANIVQKFVSKIYQELQHQYKDFVSYIDTPFRLKQNLVYLNYLINSQ